MVERHIDLSVQWKGEKLGVLEMRRHYNNYFRGLPNIKKHSSELVEIDDYQSSMGGLDCSDMKGLENIIDGNLTILFLWFLKKLFL